jgi:hypothetical protein
MPRGGCGENQRAKDPAFGSPFLKINLTIRAGNMYARVNFGTLMNSYGNHLCAIRGALKARRWAGMPCFRKGSFLVDTAEYPTQEVSGN